MHPLINAAHTPNQRASGAPSPRVLHSGRGNIRWVLLTDIHVGALLPLHLLFRLRLVASRRAIHSFSLLSSLAVHTLGPVGISTSGGLRMRNEDGMVWEDVCRDLSRLSGHVSISRASLVHTRFCLRLLRPGCGSLDADGVFLLFLAHPVVREL